MQCLIHIGCPKSGSSYIQNSLAVDRQALLEQKILIPNHGPSHQNLVPVFCERPLQHPVTVLNGIQSQQDLEDFNAQVIDDLSSEIERSDASKVVFSCELFSELGVEALYSLKAFIQQFTDDVSILCYLRAPENRFISNQLEFIRSGVATLQNPKFELFWAHQSLPRFEEVFGKSNLKTRIYARQHLIEGDIAFDFYDWIDTRIKPTIDTEKERLYSQISHPAMVLASAYNTLYPLFLDGKLNAERVLNMREVLIPGEKARYPLEHLQAVEEEFAQEREYLAKAHGITFPEYDF